MFRFNNTTGTWDIDPLLVYEVPALAALQKMRGPLALHYLGFWCRPYGFYTRLEGDAEKDRAITEAVNQTAPPGQRLVEGVYRDKHFAPAVKELTEYFEREDPLWMMLCTLKDKQREVARAIKDRDPLKPPPKDAPTFKELMDLETQITVRILEIEAELAASAQQDEYELPEVDEESTRSSFE